MIYKSEIQNAEQNLKAPDKIDTNQMELPK